MRWVAAMWLADEIFALMSSWTRVPNKVAGECTSTSDPRALTLKGLGGGKRVPNFRLVWRKSRTPAIPPPPLPLPPPDVSRVDDVESVVGVLLWSASPPSREAPCSRRADTVSSSRCRVASRLVVSRRVCRDRRRSWLTTALIGRRAQWHVHAPA